MIKTEVGVMQGKNPWNLSGLWKPEKAREWIFSPRASRRNAALPTRFRLLTYRT